MTFFVRTQDNDTIFDIDARVLRDDDGSYTSDEDFSVTVCLATYTALLFSILEAADVNKAAEFAADAENINELRGEWFEMVEGQNEWSNWKEFVHSRITAFAAKWDLFTAVD